MIKQTKKSTSLFVALAYLNGLYCNAADLLKNAEYYRAFKALEDCVCNLLETPYSEKGEEVASYAIIEEEI